MKPIFLFIICISISWSSKAQDSIVKSSITKTIALGIGGVYGYHQDTRYSNTQYRGIGIVYNLGGSRETSNRISSTQFNFRKTKESPSTFDEPKIFSSSYSFSLGYRYLHKLNNSYSIGSKVEVINGWIRETEGLLNNSFNYLIGNTWYISGHYRKELNNQWKLDGFIDFALFSIQKGTTGFAYGTPHIVLENGKFNYQDNFDEPTNLQGYGIDPFWKSLAIKTSVIISYKNRLSLGYNWNFGRFIATKSYPIYTGSHAIMVYYNIFNKEKLR